MKSIIYKSVFLCLLISSFISCGDEEEVNELLQGSTSGGSLTAKVDGNSFTSLEISTTAVLSNGILAIQGSNASGDYIKITINDYDGTAIYRTGNDESNASSMMYGTVNPINAWTSTFDIGTGTLNVSSDDGNKIKGTFNFVAENDDESNNQKNVSEGIFEIILQKQ